MKSFHVSHTRIAPTVLSVSDRVSHTMAEGLGFNWYSCFDDAVYPAPDDDARWERFMHHASWLGTNFIRYGQNAAFISDPQSGSFLPGHPSFRQLQRVNAWAESRGVNLILDPFSAPKPFRFPPWEGAPKAWGDANSDPSTAVRDIEGYVSRFLVPYVRHVIEELGCHRVTWFNFVNEPLCGGIWCTPDGIDDHRHYVEVLRAVRQGLNEAGFSWLKLMGPDTHTLRYWPLDRMLELGCDPDLFLDAYCMHQYHSHFDWDEPGTYVVSDSLTTSVEVQLRRYCQHAASRNKPLLLTELGMFRYGWKVGDPAGIARHENVLLESEFTLRALNEGAGCVLRWAWLDSGKRDGWWQLIETTQGREDPLPTSYFGYATLYRYLSARAKILKVDRQSNEIGLNTVHAVAADNIDGSRSLVVVNDHPSDCAKLRVQMPVPRGGHLRKIVNDPVRKHLETEAPQLQGNAADFEDCLSPMSVTVYTTSTRESHL